MNVRINNIAVDAALVGNRLAIRNYTGPFTTVNIEGKFYKVLMVSASNYVPGVTILTLE